MPDINTLFSAAERAFANGEFEVAHRHLLRIIPLAGDHPAVFHLLALVEKRRGRVAAAHEAFKRAEALAPKDAAIVGNHANLLAGIGDVDAALTLYRHALMLQPSFADARYNLARLLQTLGRLDEALATLDVLLATAQLDVRALNARGSILRLLDRLDDAAASFDAARALDPTSVPALHGRGRIALERGETEPSFFYRQALSHKPGDPELILGLAEALEAENNPISLQILAETLAVHPDWTVGHEILARMRSEAGEAQSFSDHYLAALITRPADRDLHLSYWRTLARAQRYEDALRAISRARATLADDAEILLMKAVFTSEAGDAARALKMLDRIDTQQPGVAFARGRIALRAGDIVQATSQLQRVVSEDPGSINGWANLDLAWRLTGDPRHEWLSRQAGLVGVRDIGLSTAELQSIADLLRRLHVTRAHPIGQSLRGGTQTRGRLFSRQEPEIVRLHAAIAAAVADHVRVLPNKDEAHPLLRHRDAALTMAGSWSVRLSSQGFHVSHIHPEGVLSSACYISLPEDLEVDTREGWLELGRPPSELGLHLDPIDAIEPTPGYLALFPSYMFHATRPFSNGERLTVAFDISTR